MKKTFVTISILLIVIAGGALITQHRSAPVIQTSHPTKVTVAEFGELFLYAPLYIADANGYFQDENLDVTIVPTGGDEKTFAALLSGDAQFGVADPTFVAISGEQGRPGMVIASVLSGAPFWGIAKEASITSLERSPGVGYSVATFPSPSTAYTLQTNMFVKHGLKPNVVEAAFGSLISTVDAKKADIALELEPNVSAAVQQGYHVVYALSDEYPRFALTGLTALPEYLRKDPQTAQRMVDALAKSMAFIRSDPHDAAQLLIKRFPEVDAQTAEAALARMTASGVFPESIKVDKEGWDAAIALRKQAGDLKGDAPYAQYIDNAFVDRIPN